jgi:hypothetical protein
MLSAVGDLVLQWILGLSPQSSSRTVWNCASNKELATLSNVSVKWCKLVQEAVVARGCASDAENILLLPSMIRQRLRQQRQLRCDGPEGETFCAVWLEPEGICERVVNPSKVPVSDEWRGYRSAHDVLHPFGYTLSFISEVFDAIDCLYGSCTESRCSWQTTFAVRGATMARPDGYCLCVASSCHGDSSSDDGDEIRRHHQRTMFQRRKDAVEDSSDSDQAPENEPEFEQLRDKFQTMLSGRRRLYRQQRKERRLDLQHDLLPRVILPWWSSGVASRDRRRSRRVSISRSRRAVQFLNSAGTNAVCMRTPPFACGPLTGPVTIFCVAIATEDGCFLSGLGHAFELGHLYPPDSASELAELSPICLATERWYPAEEAVESIKEIHDSIDSTFTAPLDENGDDCHGPANSSSPSKKSKCTCLFGHGTSTLYVDQATAASSLAASWHRDRPKARDVRRGVSGPGQWNCIVAVYNGDRSTLRVNGAPEVLQYSSGSSGSCRRAALDGLTIGSDHFFDVSLCSGNGEWPGQGEGSVAEVAVFGGRLDLADIQHLEQRAMRRYGINPAGRDTGSLAGLDVARRKHWQYTRWAALALMDDEDAVTVAPPSRIPLSYLSRHVSLAWQYRHAVTGQMVRPRRLGTRKPIDNGDDNDTSYRSNISSSSMW